MNVCAFKQDESALKSFCLIILPCPSLLPTYKRARTQYTYAHTHAQHTQRILTMKHIHSRTRTFVNAQAPALKSGWGVGDGTSLKSKLTSAPLTAAASAATSTPGHSQSGSIIGAQTNGSIDTGNGHAASSGHVHGNVLAAVLT